MGSSAISWPSSERAKRDAVMRAQLVAHHRLGRARPSRSSTSTDPLATIQLSGSIGNVEQESLVGDLQRLHAHRVGGHLGDELVRAPVAASSDVGSRLLGDAQVELQLAREFLGLAVDDLERDPPAAVRARAGLHGTPIASSSRQ